MLCHLIAFDVQSGGFQLHTLDFLVSVLVSLDVLQLVLRR